MDPDSCFESAPWEFAAGRIRDGQLGRVVAASVQETCTTGELAAAAGQWEDRFRLLFGEPVSCDRLESENAMSVLLRYEGARIVRLFFDREAREHVCNFEIVGTAGLLPAWSGIMLKR